MADTYVPMDSCHVTGYLFSYCYDSKGKKLTIELTIEWKITMRATQCKPEGHRLQGGKGPPRSCETLAGYKDFHDGGGRRAGGRRFGS